MTRKLKERYCPSSCQWGNKHLALFRLSQMYNKFLSLSGPAQDESGRNFLIICRITPHIDKSVSLDNTFRNFKILPSINILGHLTVRYINSSVGDPVHFGKCFAFTLWRYCRRSWQSKDSVASKSRYLIIWSNPDSLLHEIPHSVNPTHRTITLSAINYRWDSDWWGLPE
jgi:hypothetical protein